MDKYSETYKILMDNIEMFHSTILRSDIVKLATQIDRANSEVNVETEVKPANGDILKTINEFFEDYLLDKDKCFYIDSLKFKNNLHFATLIIRQLKIDLLSRLSV